MDYLYKHNHKRFCVKKLFNPASTRTTTFLTCSLLLVALGGAAVMEEGSNNMLSEIAKAQVTEQIEEQTKTDQSAATALNGLSVRLDRAHFIPLTPLSDSPGNQVKMLLDYTLEESSPLLDGKLNAVMEIYSAANQTLLRTSSLPEPIALDSEGTIQLATTFNDANLRDVTARALLTDAEKVNPISDPLEATIGLGEVSTSSD